MNDEWERCAVLDSNQWIEHQLLRSSHGAALLYALERHDAALGVPEVVERELKTHFRRANDKALSMIATATDTLLKLHGKVPNPAYPSTESAIAAVDDRLAELSGVVVRQRITPEHREAATDMVFDKLPPNGEKDQQYKDCLLWQAVRQLAESYDVAFVTRDRGFYASRKPDAGLAENLLADLDPDSGKVELFPSLDACLNVLTRDAPDLAYGHIASEIYSQLRDQLAESAQRRDVRPADDGMDHEMAPFATGLAGRVALSFTLRNGLRAPDGSSAGIVTSRGKCTYLTDSESIEDMQLSGFEFLIGTGDELESKTHQFVHVEPAIIGTPMRVFNLEVPM